MKRWRFRLLPLLVLLAGAAPDYSNFQERWNNPPDAPNPLLKHETYRSAAMKLDVGYTIYLPPGYEQGAERYPVIYWLHGLGGSESSDQYPIGILDKAIRGRSIQPMIVVHVSGGARTFYSDSPDGKVLSETTFVRELIPHIDRTYRTVASRAGRAIQGMSMGGFGALKMGMKYPQMFSSVVACAPSLRTWESLHATHPDICTRMFADDPQRFAEFHPHTLARQASERAGNMPPISIYVGDKDYDFLLEGVRKLRAILIESGIGPAYEEIPGVDHDLGKLAAHIGEANFTFAAKHFAPAAADQPK